jgi:serine/threonine protein kinase
MIGKTFSHYKILEKLGEGGMGVVYKAEDTKLKRTVALKFLPPALTGDLEAKERFTHEAQAASALDHPNVSTVFEINETDDGQMFMAMACYDGETLKTRIGRGPLPVDEAVGIATQVAQGLAKAHESGIVHRDIKPANILITTDGVAKIVDFGLAKLSGRTMLTKTGSTLGTAAYMSPEQARGESVDHRTDIWSLGVVLYEVIAGRRPFASEYEQALVYQILNTEPESLTRVRPETLPGLAQIVGHALAKQPAERYQTMEEFRDDLAAVAEGLKPLKAKPLADHPEKSIAVLPFINDSPDQENTYFINGVMDEILNNLQKIKALRVISRTSVEQYRERKKNVREIAEELGVNYIVEGSGQKYGNSFRLRAQLIMAEHESHLWGESFQQKITDVEDIFNIQIRIAKSIAEELKAVISPEERKLIEKIPAADLEVYDEYLKARSYWTDFTRESLNKALEFLNSAVEKNPDWAPLYAGLAEVWIWIQQAGWEPPSVAAPKIFENLNKAMELDPDLAEVHYQSAVIAQLVEWDWGKSEKEFLKALAINPNNPLSRLMYAQLLLILNRCDESLAQRELAISLDPLNFLTKLLYLGTLVQAGDSKAGLSLAQKALAANPGDININQMLEIAAYMCKDYDKVIGALKYSLPFPFEEDTYKEIEKIYRESGIVSAYEELMIHLEKYAENNYIGFMDMAFRYIIANQPDKAMDWIEKGFELHDPQMTYITKTAQIFDSLFGNPRFFAICEKMNLPLSKSG